MGWNDRLDDPNDYEDALDRLHQRADEARKACKAHKEALTSLRDQSVELGAYDSATSGEANGSSPAIVTTSVGIRVHGNEVDMLEAIKTWVADPQTDAGSIARAVHILDAELRVWTHRHE